MAHLLNVCNSHGWARSKPRASKYILHMNDRNPNAQTISCCLPTCAQPGNWIRKGRTRCIPDTVIREAVIPKGNGTTAPHTHPPLPSFLHSSCPAPRPFLLLSLPCFTNFYLLPGCQSDPWLGTLCPPCISVPSAAQKPTGLPASSHPREAVGP